MEIKHADHAQLTDLCDLFAVRLLKAKTMMKKLGRNDLYWCGSGKIYKKYHMEQGRFAERSQASINIQIASKHLVSKGQVSPARAVPAHIK